MSENENIVHIEGLLDPANYPADQAGLVNDFNKKLLAISEDNFRLTNTVSKKEQIRTTKLLDAIRVYNINISKGMIEDEIYQRHGDETVGMLNEMKLDHPCRLDDFAETLSGMLSTRESKKAIKKYLDRDRLLEAFANGETEQQLSYDMIFGDGLNHTIFHKMLLTLDENTYDIIAMCSAKDITKMTDADRRLELAQNTIDNGLRVIDGLTKDCSVIWLVDPHDFSMQLFSTSGNSFIPAAVAMAISIGEYEGTKDAYCDEYIVESERERIRKEASRENVVKKVEEAGIFTITYTRLDEDGKESYMQMVFAKTGEDDSEMYVVAFKNADSVIKREIEMAKRQERISQYEADNKAMELIHESLGSGSWSIDFDNEGEIKEVHWSNVFRNMLGYKNEDDFPNEFESWSDLLYGMDRDRVLKLFVDAVNDRTGRIFFDTDFRMFTSNNGYRWFHAAGRLSRREDGSPQTIVGLFMDIDDRKKAENRFNEQIEIVKALSRDYLNIYTVDVNERTAVPIKLDGYNFKDILCESGKTYAYDALLRQYIKERVYPEDQDAMLKAMKMEEVLRNLNIKSEYVMGYRVVDGGEIHFFQFKYIKMLINENEYKIVAAFKNVDDFVNAAKERESLIILSETDMMTGLLNRGSGEKKAGNSIKSGNGGMLCILDIDKFKDINDTYGHSVGDKVIVSVAKCLKDAFREKDIVFRLGGDEFAVFAMGEISEESGHKIFERFFKKLDEIKIPEIGERKIYTSVGAIIIEESGESSFDELYKCADRCVYKSKKTFGNMVNFYEPGD